MSPVTLADSSLHLALLDEVRTGRADGYYWLSSLRKEYAAYQWSTGGQASDELQPKPGIEDLPRLSGTCSCSRQLWMMCRRCSNADQQHSLVLMLGNSERDQCGQHASQQNDVRIVASTLWC